MLDKRGAVQIDKIVCLVCDNLKRDILVIDKREPKVLVSNDILGFAIDRASAINTYWNLYIAVATAVIGVMASGKSFTSNRALKIVITVAFVVFAFSNLWAIIKLGETRDALLNMLETDPSYSKELIESLRPNEFVVYICFHVLLDAAIVACIWLVSWPNSKESI